MKSMVEHKRTRGADREWARSAGGEPNHATRSRVRWSAAFRLIARRLAAVFAVLPLLCAPAWAAADRAANAAARDTLFYLQNVVRRSAENVVTGQYVASAACCSLNEAGQGGVDHNLAPIIRATGQTPGMIGWDYNDWNFAHPGAPVDYEALNALIVRYARQGSLTTIGYHARNPWTSKPFNDAVCPGRFTDLIDPSKPVAAAWKAQLDRVAAGLQGLQRAGVTVLWRPFLEMNGNFFSWGKCAPSAAEFRAVWKAMFDDFTGPKGLHNLLWVYAQNGGSPTPLLDPGDDLVDILGFDDYHDQVTFPGYGDWVAHGKPLAMTERGPHETDGSSRLFANLMPGIAAGRWKIAYVMAWADRLGLGYDPGGADVMNSPQAANQPEVRHTLACIARESSAAAKERCIFEQPTKGR